MTNVIVNILIKTIGIYFRASNIYLTAEIQDPIATEEKTYETIGSKISIVLENSEPNLRKISSLLDSSWRLGTVELNTETRTKAEEKFGKAIYRYTANCLELPQVCEPLIVKS